MSIQEISSDIKRLFWSQDLLLLVVVVGVAFGSFWLGRLSVSDSAGNDVGGFEAATASSIVQSSETPVDAETEMHTATATQVGSESLSLTGEQYVGSKNGTKYHLPWCSGALRIKEENKVWFASKAEAEAAGYTPAANCKGI